MASREWPPSSKKSSCTPTRSTPRTSTQIPASSSSVTVRGAAYPAANSGRAPSGAGNAARSIFPFAVNGNAANSTNTAGTMYSGRAAATTARNSATGGIPADRSAGRT